MLSAAHQRRVLVAFKRAVMKDVPLQDDEQEEQPQHHITQVTQDVVEGTENITTFIIRPYKMHSDWLFFMVHQLEKTLLKVIPMVSFFLWVGHVTKTLTLYHRCDT